MKKFDCARLIVDTEELKSKNIFKGYIGDLISYLSPTDEWIVMFTSPFYYGEFAVVKVKASNLEYAYTPQDNFTQEILNRPDFYSHTSLKPPKFKEYDHVRLICDKPEYSKEGVHKGDDGCVMFSHAHGNKWDVLFSEKGTGEDIAEIMVCEDDLELLHRIDD